MANVRYIKKLIAFYRKIQSLTPHEQTRYIYTLRRDKLKYLYELFKNLLSNKLTCEVSLIRKLKKYASVIRRIVDTTYPDIKKNVF
jgi:hypothetical protein